MDERSERRVALLRGINVGGRNRLAMADLRTMLASIGLGGVRTYIQSGNAVFDVGPDTSAPRDEPGVAAAIREVVARETSLDVAVVVCPLDEIERMARSHPDDGGEIPATYLHVLVCDRSPTGPGPDAARFAPDRWSLGPREIYVTYPDGSGRSKLTLDVFERAFGVTATARNLNTVRKIVELGREE